MTTPTTEVERSADPGPIKSTLSSRRETLVVVQLYVISIVGALVISAVLVATTGGSWREVFTALIDGSVRAPGRWGQTLGVAVPLTLVGLGTVISGRAGLINIGQEGQVMIGAAVASYVGTRLAGPGPVVLVVLLLVGGLGGALWAGIAGGLLYRRRVPEVLTTLLLVTVAFQAVGYGLQQQWLLLAPTEGRSQRNVTSEQLPADTRIPRISLFGNEFPLSALFAVLLAFLVAYLLARSIWGFRLRVMGLNARTAKRVGISDARYGTAALMLSGGFAGLAGAMMLGGGDFGNYRLTPGFPVNVGFDGLLVALVARQRPLLVVPLAFVFASLRTGSGFLAATGVEREITQIVQALLVLALLVPPAILFVRERRRALAATIART